MEDIIKQILQEFRKVNVNDLGKFVFSQANIQRWVIDTIQNRIKKTGIDAFGEKLKTDSSSSGEVYSFMSIVIRDQLGLQSDHVDLHLTGNFYKTFKVFLKSNSLVIDADFDKGAGKNIADNFTRDYSQKEFENAIESLSESEIDLMLNTVVFQEVIKYLNKTLPNAA
jgi:hypothetical protein